jgi:hypothetical protein
VTSRKLAVLAVVALAAFVLITTIAIYLLWSRGEEPPTRSEPVNHAAAIAPDVRA